MIIKMKQELITDKGLDAAIIKLNNRVSKEGIERIKMLNIETVVVTPDVSFIRIWYLGKLE